MNYPELASEDTPFAGLRTQWQKKIDMSSLGHYLLPAPLRGLNVQ